MGQHNVKPLFSGGRFQDKITQVDTDISREIRELGRQLTPQNVDQVVQRLASKYRFPKGELTTHKAEVKDGVVEYTILFQGSNGTFFEYRPSQFTHNVPHADVISNAMYMYYNLQAGVEAVKAEFARDYENLKQWVERLTIEVNEFNEGLKDRVRAAVERRLAELKQEVDFEDALNS